jgi:hypothetical protein
MALAGTALTLPARGQAVVSTRSGVVHFFDGVVYVDGQALEARFGKFTNIPEGSGLRTEQGRAEVLLTPGVFLRVGEKSAIRMIASTLADTRVELLAGSVMVESAEPVVGTSVTLIYKDWTIHQPQQGLYRVDCDPPRLQVRQGQVEVSAAGAGAPVPVEQGMDLPLGTVLTAVPSAAGPRDALSDWAEGRAQSISADNAIAANIQDPASLSGLDLPADSFTYFPMLGFASLPPSVSSVYGTGYQSGLYNSSVLYQPGFYSVYLPGYTYRPLLLGLPSLLPRLTYPPSRSGLPSLPPLRLPTPRPITPVPLPHPVTPALAHPVTPALAHPVTPALAHPVTPLVVHH